MVYLWCLLIRYNCRLENTVPGGGGINGGIGGMPDGGIGGGITGGPDPDGGGIPGRGGPPGTANINKTIICSTMYRHKFCNLCTIWILTILLNYTPSVFWFSLWCCIGSEFQISNIIHAVIYDYTDVVL